MPNFFWEIDIQFNNFSRITNNKNFNFWKTVEIRFLMKLSFLRQLNVCKCVQIQINLNKNKRKVVFQRTALWHPRLPAERWQNPLHQHFALATNLYGPDTDHWERECKPLILCTESTAQNQSQLQFGVPGTKGTVVDASRPWFFFLHRDTCKMRGEGFALFFVWDFETLFRAAWDSEWKWKDSLDGMNYFNLITPTAI